MKRVLLISNKVMHYRVSVYNYFFRRFRDQGVDFIVRANELQKENAIPLEFDFEAVPFSFQQYRREIADIEPDAVILFLHLKDKVIWPLVHWLKMKKIPVVYWTKGVNLDDPDNTVKYMLYNHLHTICDGLILYSGHEMKYIKEKNRQKVFIAHNTVNFEDYPPIEESAEAIKRDLKIPFNKVVLSVGRMGVGGGRKKIDHLIRIFRDIDISDAGLVIVGSGITRQWLDLMNKRNTVYLGEIHDSENRQISRIFKMADLFSIPGHVGLGLNQAFYWGLPIVTEEGGQPPEVHYLIDGRNGYLVPGNDLEELRNKIVSLLENDDVRREFSRHAREDILKNASVEVMFQGFRRCIDSLPGFLPGMEAA